jgi:glyoxylase-like metal-dependent hydrolase (beta-lactamase superfamily II)
MSEYEIYAVKFAGPFTGSGAFLMWNKHWDEVYERNYYIWCLKNDERTIVVDAGVSPQLAQERNLTGYVSPAEVLKGIDVQAEDVEHVILTHLHWDHVDGAGLFPNARFYVQKAERDFWLHDETANRPPLKFFLNDTSRAVCTAIEDSGRMALVDGDQNILPGVDCLLAPGHSVALQGVAVNSSRGLAILGSDCGHLFRNYKEDWPSSLIIDMVGWMHSMEKLRSRVAAPELLFPGHDPLMANDYPEVAPGITRLV